MQGGTHWKLCGGQNELADPRRGVERSLGTGRNPIFEERFFPHFFHRNPGGAERGVTATWNRYAQRPGRHQEPQTAHLAKVTGRRCVYATRRPGETIVP